jgi:sarcosine oxidase subunit beta
MMAALIDYCEGGEDHDKNPLQFSLNYLEKRIDVGFYSRLREINPESSFSVIG